MYKTFDVATSNFAGAQDQGQRIYFLVSASPPKLLDDAAKTTKTLHVHWSHDVALYDLDLKSKVK